MVKDANEMRRQKRANGDIPAFDSVMKGRQSHARRELAPVRARITSLSTFATEIERW